jgi:membrane dipeptidase
VIARVVDRLLNTMAVAGPCPVRHEVAAFHGSIPVVDLLVGTVLFRRGFLGRRRHGHVDLPRLRQGGVNLVGLSVATRFPDLQGSLSTPHLMSLGVPWSTLRKGTATTEMLIARIDGWAERSRGRLQVVRTRADLDAVLQPNGPTGAFIGLQGAHALDGDLANLGRLRDRGVRMLAPAHVMDNTWVGSGTGRRAGGLTPKGRTLIAELERSRVLVDLAHMSPRGLRDSVPLLHRPFVLSHTGFVERCSRPGWRRYSAATRNVATEDARLVASSGAVVGVVDSTSLLGGSSVTDLVDTIRWAIDELGPEHVALGSDHDGALRSVLDASGTPLITQGLLDAGVAADDVAAVMGGNALRVLRNVLD